MPEILIHSGFESVDKEETFFQLVIPQNMSVVAFPIRLINASECLIGRISYNNVFHSELKWMLMWHLT